MQVFFLGETVVEVESNGLRSLSEFVCELDLLDAFCSCIIVAVVSVCGCKVSVL